MLYSDGKAVRPELTHAARGSLGGGVRNLLARTIDPAWITCTLCHFTKAASAVAPASRLHQVRQNVASSDDPSCGVPQIPRMWEL
jgi:hypothetical protein